MFDKTPNIIDWIAGAAAAGLVMAAALAAAVLRWRRRAARTRFLEERLGVAEEFSREKRVLRLWRDGREATTTVPLSRWRDALVKRLSLVCRDAGWDMPMETLLVTVAGLMGLAGTLVTMLSRSLVWGALAAAVVPVATASWVRRRTDRRAALFERQLIDAMELASRSLRAGHPLLGAFRLISEEMEAPMGTIFAEICQQQQLGAGLEGALRQAGAESSSTDLKLFATAVTIQLRSGGNLADLMDRLAEVIRDRIRLSRRVRVLTAQTQFSKRVLLALPVVVFLLLNVMRPEYMHTLYATSTGQMALAVAGGGMVLGAWVMNRLARLKE